MTVRIPAPTEEVVIRAWLAAGGAWPRGVERIGQRRSKKSFVYRLWGAGDEGLPVIAKLCRGPNAKNERRIYEEVLPQLEVPLLRFYGAVEQELGIWLFLEDGGATRCDLDLPEHRRLAGAWLARLHGAGSLIARPDLPDRGPAHHLALVRGNRRTILDNLGNPAFDDDHRGVLDRVLVVCDELESRWNEIEAVCAELPETFVHGDFCTKNLHVRRRGEGDEFFVMDWEMSGWGVPACDIWPHRKARRLPICDLGVYAETLRVYWPGLDERLLRRIVAVGQVFRNLNGVAWSSRDLRYAYPDKPIPSLRIYGHELDTALRETAWAA